jgi:uncharacterized membrane protein
MADVSIALTLHALAAGIWVGGMGFAYWFVRPSAEALEPPQRQTLWRDIFQRFFPWVWVSAVVLIATGYYMIFAAFGGFAGSGVHVHVMHLLGWAMVLIFAHVYFAPWRRFRNAVAAGDRQTAGANLGKIRRFVGINLALGLIVVAVGAGGRYWG